MLTDLERLKAAWQRPISAPSRATRWLLLLAALFASAHVARYGTFPVRVMAAAGLVAVVALLVLVSVRARRQWRSARGVLRRVLVPSDPKLGHRALRALDLAQRTERHPEEGSPELAQLHYERLVQRASVAGVTSKASARARLWRMAALGLGASLFLVTVIAPTRMLEGLDVLLARNGQAPFAMKWLSLVEVTAQPPTYLREPRRVLFWGVENRFPQGSELTVRGIPLRAGRRLVLTDGQREVAFVSDAAGGVVARWELVEDAELRVAARFGEVLIEESEAVDVRAQPDLAPKVDLEGAPKSLQLADLDRLELRYEAEDDHGLRQIDLVLRSGAREERKVLARLDGQSAQSRGGHALDASGRFLRHLFLPATIRIEARDNDSATGPKWGSSEAITIHPPAVGSPEAKRVRALLAARKVVTDYVAALSAPEQPAAEQKEEVERLRQRAIEALRSAVHETGGGLPLPAGLGAFVLGQARKLEDRPKPGKARKVAEDVLLGIDVGTQGIATRDARQVSKILGDVAEEAAEGAQQARESEALQAGLARVDAALEALARGAIELRALGTLGNDLGSVAQGELDRIGRARKAKELMNTELAARHLAARLRRPNPSFGSAARGGVESGMTPGEASGSASNADQQFNELVGELEQLAQRHAGEIARVEQTLNEAKEQLDLSDMADEATRRANVVRDAASGLPTIGANPGTARAAAAMGREHANAMADALQQLDLKQAVDSGQQAVSSLRDAERKASEGSGRFEQLDLEALRKARAALEEQLEWAKRALENAERRASQQSQSSLTESAERERELSQRAQELSARGDEGQGALPQDILENLKRAREAMREAAEALQKGEGDKGKELQLEAQRWLEQSATGRTTDHGSREEDGDGREMSREGEVPGADDSKKAEEFRRRVVEGLGKRSGGKIEQAVRRYAEGLLQ